MNLGIQIDFSEEEHAQIVAEALSRTAALHVNYRDDGWHDLGGVPREHRDIQGRLGEHAAARAFGLSVQPALLPEGRDDHIDFWIKRHGEDRSVEVRFAPYSYGQFIVKKAHKALKADIGILVVPVDRTWEYATRCVSVLCWIDRDGFAERAVLKDLGYSGKEVWALPQNLMRPIDELISAPEPPAAPDVPVPAAGPSCWPPNPYLREYLASDAGRRYMAMQDRSTTTVIPPTTTVEIPQEPRKPSNLLF